MPIGGFGCFRPYQLPRSIHISAGDVLNGVKVQEEMQVEGREGDVIKTFTGYFQRGEAGWKPKGSTPPTMLIGRGCAPAIEPYDFTIGERQAKLKKGWRGPILEQIAPLTRTTVKRANGEEKILEAKQKVKLKEGDQVQFGRGELSFTYKAADHALELVRAPEVSAPRRTPEARRVVDASSSFRDHMSDVSEIGEPSELFPPPQPR